MATAIPVAASTPMTTAADDPVIARPAARAPAVRAELGAASRSRERLVLLAPRTEKSSEPTVRLRPRWTSTLLNVRSRPNEDSRLLTVLDARAKVQVTGATRGSWAEIAWKDRTAWVHKGYLARTKPALPTRPTGVAVQTPAGVSGSPCPDGSAVESGLQPNTVKVYRAVCAAFPAVTSWGGRSGSGDHGAGLALDIMCSGSLGDSIASYVRAHASALGVSEVIWSQRIWTVQRSSEGWRPMEDRGSTTANHYDHVHVSVYY